MRLGKSPKPAAEPAAPPAGPERPKRVRRPQVIRRLTALYDEPRYLEVGVADALTFDKVEVPHKVAVDPEFRFDHEAPERLGIGADYHQVTSDVYFSTLVAPDAQFDVIYLDGLHVFEQTLRDLMNALDHLQPHGVIVIDDTRPPTHLASLPDRAQFFELRSWLGSTDKRWMGDVFKLVWFIDTFCPQLTYRSIADNHGQTVVWRKARPAVTERPMAEIAAMTFEQMVTGEEVLQLRPFAEIVEELKADLGLEERPAG